MNNQKTILIIGGGVKQLPLIRHAQANGCRLAVLDRDAKAPGFEYADWKIIASTRDVEDSLRQAVDFNRTVPLSGVTTMASESAVTVATIASELGLPGVNVAAAWNATHKVDRQACFARAKVASPRYSKALDFDAALKAAEEIGWPVVVKPVDSAGSRGVQKVNGPEELQSAVDELRMHSARPEFILEEFLEGTEHSIEGIVLDGVVHWTGFSDRNYDKKEKYAPYFLEDGDTLPSALSAEMIQQVKERSTQAVHALGIDWGPAKGDILIDSEGPKVIEMAARLSGDYFCDVTTPLHNGINIMEVLFDMALGREIDADRLKPRFEKGVALRYLWPLPGVVSEIRGLEEVRSWPGIHFVDFEPAYRDLSVGSLIKRPESMGERVGSVMAVGETGAAAVKLAEKAVQTIQILTQ